MCNAYNHGYDCACGFGGDTGGGGSSVRPRTWSLWTASDPVTYASSCWWCGASVFFYRDERGGCALFDELGAPWQVHGCWEEYRRDRHAAIAHVDRLMAEEGYEGSPLELEFVEVPEPARAGWVGPFWGYVVSTDSSNWAASSTLHRWGEYDEDLAELAVAYDHNIYRMAVPLRFLEDIQPNMIIQVTGRWLKHSRGMLLLGSCIVRHDLDGRLVKRERWRKLESAPVVCGHCGARIRSGEAWGLVRPLLFECEQCRTIRSGLAPGAYRRHCRKVARASGFTAHN